MIDVKHFRFETRGNIIYLNNKPYLFTYLSSKIFDVYNENDKKILSFLEHRNLRSIFEGNHNLNIEDLFKKLPVKVFIKNVDNPEYINYTHFILKSIIGHNLTIETPDGKKSIVVSCHEDIFLEDDFIEFQNEIIMDLLNTLSNENYDLKIEKNLLKEIFGSKSFIVSEK